MCRSFWKFRGDVEVFRKFLRLWLICFAMFFFYISGSEVPQRDISHEYQCSDTALWESFWRGREENKIKGKREGKQTTICLFGVFVWQLLVLKRASVWEAVNVDDTTVIVTAPPSLMTLLFWATGNARLMRERARRLIDELWRLLRGSGRMSFVCRGWLLPHRFQVGERRKFLLRLPTAFGGCCNDVRVRCSLAYSTVGARKDWGRRARNWEGWGSRGFRFTSGMLFLFQMLSQQFSSRWVWLFFAMYNYDMCTHVKILNNNFHKIFKPTRSGDPC